MKRFAGIILLMLMGYNLIGYFPAFYTMQQQIKREMRSAFRIRQNRNELTALTFITRNNKVTDAAFKQLEENEFSYKGEMYDVVRIEKSANTITFYCLKDKKETQLFTDLQQFVKQNSAENPFQKSSKLFHSFCKQEFISAYEIAFHNSEKYTQSIFSTYHIWKSAKHTFQLSPPPEFLI